MYTNLEIIAIFKGCKNFHELTTCCEIFLELINDGDLSQGTRRIIRLYSAVRFREL
jgi:hypothetical protein